MRPPGVKNRWEDNTSEAQAYLLSYSQIRDLEEAEEKAMTAFRGII